MPQLPLWSEKLTQDDVLAVFTPDDPYLTRAQIADRLGSSKKKSLIDLIENMVVSGVLIRRVEPLANRAPVFVYVKAQNG